VGPSGGEFAIQQNLETGLHELATVLTSFDIMLLTQMSRLVSENKGADLFTFGQFGSKWEPNWDGVQTSMDSRPATPSFPS
jgi:hypothetical protein